MLVVGLGQTIGGVCPKLPPVLFGGVCIAAHWNCFLHGCVPWQGKLKSLTAVILHVAHHCSNFWLYVEKSIRRLYSVHLMS